MPDDYQKVTVNITVMDKENLRKDLVVGNVNIPLSKLRDKEGNDEWYPLVPHKDTKGTEQSTLHVSLYVDSKVC